MVLKYRVLCALLSILLRGGIVDFGDFGRPELMNKQTNELINEWTEKYSKSRLVCVWQIQGKSLNMPTLSSSFVHPVLSRSEQFTSTANFSAICLCKMLLHTIFGNLMKNPTLFIKIHFFIGSLKVVKKLI